MKKVLFILVMIVMLTVFFIPVALAADGEPAGFPALTEAVDTGVDANAPIDEPPNSAVSGTSTLDMLGVAIMLALVIEKLAEIIKSKISPHKLKTWAWFIITSGLGITLCILFQVNLFISVGLSCLTPATFLAGEIITGIAVGSGSNFTHDLIDRLKSTKLKQ